MIAGSVVSPPQWPECTPPSRSFTTRSKWKMPRVPVAMVGTAGVHPRPVGGDQHIGGQLFRVRGDEFAQALEPRSSRHLQHQLDVEAEPAAAFRQHRVQRRQVQRVLALVVGGAAAVPAVALLGQRPGQQAGAPLVFQTAHRIAMAVEQDGRAGRVLDARRRSGSGRSRPADSDACRRRSPGAPARAGSPVRGSVPAPPRHPAPARSRGSPPAAPAAP